MSPFHPGGVMEREASCFEIPRTKILSSASNRLTVGMECAARADMYVTANRDGCISRLEEVAGLGSGRETGNFFKGQETPGR